MGVCIEQDQTILVRFDNLRDLIPTVLCSHPHVLMDVVGYVRRRAVVG